jgi:threonine dehydrogenase-like Zn-dependent dehydrogenase
MSTMQAAFFDGMGRMVVKAHPKPAAGPGDAVVRVYATGICGSDLQMNVDKTQADENPAGHEVAGEIVEVGKGVDTALVGKRVAMDTLGHGRACLTCWYCRQGQYKQCLDMYPVQGGGFAQFIKRKAAGCYVLPDHLSWQEGALVEPFAVAIHSVRRGQLIAGETVLVLGAGSIGLTAVAAARALGAGKIFVTARYEQQVLNAKKLGADEAFPSDSPQLIEAINDTTDGRGVDLTIETVGGFKGDPIQQAIDLTRRQGRFVIVGGYRRPVTLDWLPPMLKEQTIVFSSCYNLLDGRHDYDVAIDLLASGTVPLQQIVTHIYALEDIQKGFETAYDKATGSIKVQIHQQ